MKKKRSLAGIIALVTLLSSFASFSPIVAYADTAMRGINFDCEYSIADSKLTVTASVNNPDINVNTAMFVLDYDKSLLTTDSDKVTFITPATKSAVYHSDSGDKGRVGADWYYASPGLAKASTPSGAVSVEFDVKDGTKLDDLKNAMSVCADKTYLDSIGGYGSDGGVLLCVTSSEYYNAENKTAEGKFTFKQVTPSLIFDSDYSPDSRVMTTTVSIDNPKNKVGAAMFVLKYDDKKLSPKASVAVSYLGNAKESRTYSNPESHYIGADWYYDTALPASSTPTQAVKLVFDVPVGALPDSLGSALSVCTDDAYLKSLTYGDDGGILISEDGTKSYNAKNDTAAAVFKFGAKEPPPPAPESDTYNVTVTKGTAKVGNATVTKAKAGDTVTITADAPEAGSVFKSWETVAGDLPLASSTSATTTFVMPANDVSLKALYEPTSDNPKTYKVTVTNGTAKVGDQVVTSAKAGETVTIVAGATDSAGNAFEKWAINSGKPNLANSRSATTTFIMPASDVSLTANYKNNSGGGGGGGSKTGDSIALLWIAMTSFIVASATLVVLWYRKRKETR